MVKGQKTQKKILYKNWNKHWNSSSSILKKREKRKNASRKKEEKKTNFLF
jgi:hypothetical protein